MEVVFHIPWNTNFSMLNNKKEVGQPLWRINKWKLRTKCWMWSVSREKIKRSTLGNTIRLIILRVTFNIIPLWNLRKLSRIGIDPMVGDVKYSGVFHTVWSNFSWEILQQIFCQSFYKCNNSNSILKRQPT